MLLLYVGIKLLRAIMIIAAVIILGYTLVAVFVDGTPLSYVFSGGQILFMGIAVFVYGMLPSEQRNERIARSQKRREARKNVKR